VRTGAASPREKLWVLPRQVQKIAAEKLGSDFVVEHILFLNKYFFTYFAY
jgi:hypothetical protein